MKIKSGKCVTEVKLKFNLSETDQLSIYNYKLLILILFTLEKVLLHTYFD